PLILDPVYGYQAINVDAQMRSPSSLLNWTRKLLGIRREHPVFGMGSYEELGTSNPSTLAFVREFGDDLVLCVNNLSRFPQPVELDLRRFEGSTPVEMTGLVPFPPIGDLPYLLSLPGHGFLWFSLTPSGDDA
ncbi:MAG: alpha-glucosidase C-terminal domain-containing protein, partial [Mycobacteriales bacterium]